MPAVIDGHADFAIHYLRRGWSTDAYDIETSLPGQADVSRWRAGGVDGALATVGSDLPPGSVSHFPRVLASLDWLEQLAVRHSSAITIVGSAAEFDQAASQGRISLLPALEGGDQIDGSLAHLRTAYARGVRSLLIVYDHNSPIGDGAMTMPDSGKVAAPAHGGLSPFGRELVAEMNRLGMIVDLSHAAQSTALDAMQMSTAPVIFSHSGARALANTSRNLSDEVLRAVRVNRGVVMVPLVPYLTTTEHWRWWRSGEQRYFDLVEQGLGEAAIAQAMKDWDASNEQPKVTVAHVADQIDYVARIAGKEHVGIGTDFDGMGSFAIPDLKDASGLSLLLGELVRRGWNRTEIEGLARGNFLRVLREVEERAGTDP